MARRSKWLVFAEGDDRVQTEPLDCSGDGSAAGQQEAQLVQANVKAARAKQAQSRALQAITGLVDVAVYHKSDLLDAPKAAAELAKLLHLPVSKRKGAHLRQLQTLSRHLVLPDEYCNHPHAAAIWQLCHQEMQLVQKQAGQTVVEHGTAAKHWVWLLTGDVTLPGQPVAEEASADESTPVGGILHSSSGGPTSDVISSNGANSRGSRVPCFSLLNPGAHQLQPQPVALVAATNSVQLAIMDVCCYTKAVKMVKEMEQQKLVLREALLAPGNQRTEQQMRQIKGLLHVHPTLQHLPASVRASSASMLGYLTAQPGTMLYDSGDSMDAWYIILSGKLRLVHPHVVSAGGAPGTSTSGTSIDSSNSRGNSVSGDTPGAPDELDYLREGQNNYSANAAPGNSTICLMPGLMGAHEQPLLTVVDISSNKERQFESRAICGTFCELGVLGRTEFATLVANQQENLVSERLKILRDHDVFARRTVALAQRIAEVCTDVQAAPGALIMAHGAGAAAAATETDPTSPKAAESRNVAPGTDSSINSNMQRGPLIAGTGYAFIAEGECLIVCKVLVDRGRQQAQAAVPTAAADRSGDTAVGASPGGAGIHVGSHGPTAARPGSPAKMHAASGSAAVLIPLLQLGPGEMLATTALTSCEATEVSVVAHSNTHIVWLSESLAQHHLGPQGVGDLSQAAEVQSSRLQQLLADAVAARQDMLLHSRSRGNAEARQAMKQVPQGQQLQQLPAVPAAPQGLEGTGCTAGQQSPGSMTWAPAAPASAYARMSVAQTAELAFQLLEQQDGVAIPVIASARSVDIMTGTQHSSTAEHSPAKLRAMSLVSLGILSDGLDTLHFDVPEPASKANNKLSLSPPRQWDHVVQSGSRQLEQGASRPAAATADAEAAGLAGIAAAPDSGGPEQAFANRPTAGITQRQQLEALQNMPAPRVRISTAIQKQMLVAPAGSPQLLPHTRNRSNTLLSGSSDSATGGVELDPPASSMTLQDAGFGVYGGFAGAGSLAEQLHQQVSTNPRVVVLPGLAAATGTAQGRLGRNRAVSSKGSTECKEQLQEQLASRSPVSAARLGHQWQDPVHADGRQPRGSMTEIASSASRGASIIDSKSSVHISAAKTSITSSLQPQRLPGPLPNLTWYGSAPMGSCSKPATANSTGSAAQSPGAGNTASSYSSKVNTAATGWRKSEADQARLADLLGPLELDPAAPPLGSVKLSRPDQSDMEYALHRWSQRWQSERARLAAPIELQDQSADPQSQQNWVRKPDDLSLFGGAPVDGVAPQRVKQ